MEFIEVSAKTVDEAITKACIALGASSDKLEIQVISEGSSGFLGFGSKPAVIRAGRKPEEEPAEEAVEEPEEKEEPAVQPREAKKEKRERREEKKEEPKPAKKPAVQDNEPAPRTEEEIAAMKKSAEEFLTGVFRAMELPVEIKIVFNKETGSLDIDFAGEDMGILIGKRGQTLDSLQYLTSLVVNKEQKEYVRVKLDTENYRKRRKETLENLARNIAYKVKKTRKPVSLEPMNPYERRIIHSALQSNKFVETYSEGNEPYRHVVVTPKRHQPQQ